ncbi:MAG: hypothetical protein LBT86_05015 [Deltaproteobacteria bacterium]|jgi:hypothetical protein|nr:hypothetical protein [Deltaproteobacteria bacterium]
MSPPTLRCPECGQLVNLPAEACACGFNFRLGTNLTVRPPKPSLFPSDLKKPILIGAAVALALLIVILALVFSHQDPPPSGAPAQAGGSVLAPAPALSESILLRPQVPIGQARDAASLANDHVQRLRDTRAEIDAETAH